jgi:hypothetical protein
MTNSKPQPARIDSDPLESIPGCDPAFNAAIAQLSQVPAVDPAQRLAELGNDHAAVVHDWALMAALRPLRCQPPVRVRCRKRGCAKTVCWCSLLNDGTGDGPALVVYGPSRRQAKHFSGLGGIYDLSYPPPDPTVARFGWMSWVKDEREPTVTEADPGLGSGYPLRYQLRCPRCGATYPATNTRMLRDLLDAWRSGVREFIL